MLAVPTKPKSSWKEVPIAGGKGLFIALWPKRGSGLKPCEVGTELRMRGWQFSEA